MEAPLTKLESRRLFIAIIFLAFVLRLWGIWHGYPFSYYPDEAHFVKRALSFASGDLNPHWFHKPAFYMYLLFTEYGLYFIVGKIAGLWPSMSEFAASYIRNPGPFYVIGRFTTILFSVGSVWLVYKIGKQHFKKDSGILAALLLSLSYGHIAASQNIKADTPAMFFTILSIFFLLNYVTTKIDKNLLWAAMFAGVGTATKYYPILLLLPIIMSVILVNWDRANNIIWPRIGKIFRLTMFAVVLFFLLFFICSPFNFIDPAGLKYTFKPIFKVLAKSGHLMSPPGLEDPGNVTGQRMGILPGATNYIMTLMSNTGMGISIAGIGILGFIHLFSGLSRKRIIFLLYPAVFMAVSVLMYPGLAKSRHQLPVYPFLAISGGALIVYITNKYNVIKSILISGLLVSLLYPTYNIIDRAIVISHKDTRQIAKEWIEQNIPAGTKVLLDENGPQLLMSEKRIHKMLEKAEQADPNGQFTAHYDKYLRYQQLAAAGEVTYDLYYIRYPWWREKEVKEGVHELTSDRDKDKGNPLKEVGVNSYEYYVKSGFEYAIVHSYKYERFMHDNGASRKFPSFTRFYRELFKRGKLLKTFSPVSKEKRCRPKIRIFRFRI